MSVTELSKEEGISKVTLYYWRKQFRESGTTVPNIHTTSELQSAQTKLAVITETYSMTENELSQYCREKGLFPQQIQTWQSECIQEFKSKKEIEAETKKQALEIKELKKSFDIKKRYWLKQQHY